MASLAEEWLEMAEASYRSADLLLAFEAENDVLRSTVSRLYFAAFQACTGLLHQAGVTPPERHEDEENWEGWSHAMTPDLVRRHLAGIVKKRGVRTDLAGRLRRLRWLRIGADYQSRQPLPRHRVQDAKKDVGFILRVAQETIR